jgi:hypothetical protein
MLIPEIDGLLKADEKNVQEMRRVFAAFSQDLPELLNRAVTLYTTSARAFAQGVSHDVRNLPKSEVDEATSTEFEAKLMRGQLLCRIGVLYGIAAAEFLRMRITTPFACIRALSTYWGYLQNRLVEWDAEIISRPFLGPQWDV